ncbi:MBL fold metallo-hydrolase [Granulosicoccus sp. 3-233]|uniref:MBL fold metallo-hydrolase n=1 Tax=Granulosicoccus sp. 3-233 TaxID=3417969 RepID=UPI003D33C014
MTTKHLTSTTLQTQPVISRRRMLAASVALPVTATVFAGLKDAHADGHASEAQPNAIKNTFTMGDLEVSTLLAGTRTVDAPQNIFGMNVSEEEFQTVSEANFLPTDKAQFFFTPTVVRSGTDVILFDTGLNPAGITAPLAAAGISPDEVTVVVITHMHGDHIGGLAGDDGTPTFANARYVTGQVEYDAWAKMDNEGFKAKVQPLAEKMEFIGDGDSVISGITGMSAAGHTPGHMMYMLESGGRQLALVADTANHYVWSLAYPEWEVKFDMDKAKAAATRKTVFDMLATDKVPFVGYHMPFPGMGYVETRGEGGYRYVPTSYQMML